MDEIFDHVHPSFHQPIQPWIQVQTQEYQIHSICMTVSGTMSSFFLLEFLGGYGYDVGEVEDGTTETDIDMLCLYDFCMMQILVFTYPAKFSRIQYLFTMSEQV